MKESTWHLFLSVAYLTFHMQSSEKDARLTVLSETLWGGELLPVCDFSPGFWWPQDTPIPHLPKCPRRQASFRQGCRKSAGQFCWAPLPSVDAFKLTISSFVLSFNTRSQAAQWPALVSYFEDVAPCFKGRQGWVGSERFLVKQISQFAPLGRLSWGWTEIPCTVSISAEQKSFAKAFQEDFIPL